MPESVKQFFENSHPQQQTDLPENIRVVADEKNPYQHRVYFGKGENDYLNVRGTEQETALLADAIGKLAESKRTMAKLADVPPEDRPLLIAKETNKNCGGFYQSADNFICVDSCKSHGYAFASCLAHELQHFEQFRRMNWNMQHVHIAEQIFIDRIGEAAADTARYQYLYDIKDNPAAKAEVANALLFEPGAKQYFEFKNNGKSEGECVLAAMGGQGYAANTARAESYAGSYHREVCDLGQNSIDWYNSAPQMEQDRRNIVAGSLRRILVFGDKVDETLYFKQLTTGMMSELPADEKITQALRDPEFDYVPQNAYDKMKRLKPAVAALLPNERFLQGVNVKVHEFGRHGVCSHEEYDKYKAEKAAEQQRVEIERAQVNLMRAEARKANPDWTDLHGDLHNLSADIDRKAAVEKLKAEQKTPQNVDADCLAAGDDGTALRLLWQKENKAFRMQVSQLYGKFKTAESAAKADLKNKMEAERVKNAAVRALEDSAQTADLMRGVVDDLVSSYPASMRKDVRAALLKSVEEGKKAEMPKPKTLKDKISIMFGKRKIAGNQTVVDNTFQQVKDKTALKAAIDSAKFDKELSAARRDADKAFADRMNAERQSGAPERILNAECQKLHNAMFKAFEVKAGQMLYARQTQQQPQTNESKKSLQDKTNLMQTLQSKTKQTAPETRVRQPMPNIGMSR